MSCGEAEGILISFHICHKSTKGQIFTVIQNCVVENLAVDWVFQSRSWYRRVAKCHPPRITSPHSLQPTTKSSPPSSSTRNTCIDVNIECLDRNGLAKKVQEAGTGAEGAGGGEGGVHHQYRSSSVTESDPCTTETESMFIDFHLLYSSLLPSSPCSRLPGVDALLALDPR